jgi:FAD/FMN-containing dehydrogenase
MAPLISDVESFDLLGADGVVRTCSRSENPDRFALAIGGYGLFGVITRLRLRLARRRKLRRVVRVLNTDELMPHLASRVAAGDAYGDFQFSVDETSPDFLRRGVCATYEPVDPQTPMGAVQTISREGWLRLLELAHTDRARAFREYVKFYEGTAGQIYWSDLHQLGPYVPNYAQVIGERTGARERTSLAISELYVPREALALFLQESARVLRVRGAVVVYGTVRLIQRDLESFLPWAQGDFACVIFNLLARHMPAGLAINAEAFRDLIDVALAHGGTFYLTYHRHARRDQLVRGHPRIAEFIRRKAGLDPESVFESDWYRHTKSLVDAGH